MKRTCSECAAWEARMPLVGASGTYAGGGMTHSHPVCAAVARGEPVALAKARHEADAIGGEGRNGWEGGRW